MHNDVEAAVTACRLLRVAGGIHRDLREDKRVKDLITARYVQLLDAMESVNEAEPGGVSWAWQMVRVVRRWHWARIGIDLWCTRERGIDG